MEFKIYYEKLLEKLGEILEKQEKGYICTPYMIKDRGHEIPAISVCRQEGYPPMVFKIEETDVSKADITSKAEEILGVFEEMNHNLDMEYIENHIVPENVVPVLKNGEKIAGLEGSYPFVKMEDMAILFQIELPSKNHGEAYNIKISKKIMEEWGMDTQTLYETALNNLKAKNSIQILMLESVLYGIFNDAEAIPLTEKTYREAIFPLVIVTNEKRTYGANGILDTERMQKVSEIMGEDFYIIPSSVHECILLPKSCLKPTEIQKDLLAINASELLTGEKLSDKVYEYCSELKKIRVVENKERKEEHGTRNLPR